jgi:pyridoxamine 5'-phosphate oxidase
MTDKPRLTTLAEIEAALWQELACAPLDKQHEWRVAVLATTDGEVADARSVVLREVDTASATLLVFSDARAAKLAHLETHPVGTLVVWSQRLLWQLRLRVHLTVQTEGLAVASRWAQDYLSPLPPGQQLATADEARPQAMRERGHFAVLSARVLSADWLELHPAQHRRARFDEAGARWLVP